VLVGCLCLRVSGCCVGVLLCALAVACFSFFLWSFLGQSGNQEPYVLWKEFMPLFGVLLPSPSHPSLSASLLGVVGLLGDILGWAFNPSFLTTFHERIFQVSHLLECLVRVVGMPHGSRRWPAEVHWGRAFLSPPPRVEKHGWVVGLLPAGAWSPHQQLAHWQVVVQYPRGERRPAHCGPGQGG
jgi:hypothetical protein